MVIFDTEFTAWEGSKARNWSEPWEHREMIQLAALKLEVINSTLKPCETLNVLIKPHKNPQLSSYIVELTGISQETIDEQGVDFSSAMQLFYHFTGEGKQPCYSWGNDIAILRDNCQLNGIRFPAFAGGFCNLRELVRSKVPETFGLCSGELADFLGVKVEGHYHNALHDVRSIAVALQHWLQRRQLTLEELNIETDSLVNLHII